MDREFFIGVYVNDGGGIRDHSKILTNYEDASRWCASVIGSKSNCGKVFIMKSTDRVILEVAPVKYIPTVPASPEVQEKQDSSDFTSTDTTAPREIDPIPV